MTLKLMLIIYSIKIKKTTKKKMKKIYKFLLISIFCLTCTLSTYSQKNAIISKEAVTEVKNTVSSATSSLSEGIDSMKQGAITVATGVKETVKAGVNNVDTGSLFRSVYQDTKSAITGIASALKVGAEHVYKVLVVQQVVRGVTYLLMMVFGFLFLYLSIRFFKSIQEDYNAWKKLEDIDPDTDSYFHINIIWCGAFAVAGPILLLVAFGNFDVITMGLINPEYGALQSIMDFAKNLNK